MLLFESLNELVKINLFYIVKNKKWIIQFVSNLGGYSKKVLSRGFIDLKFYSWHFSQKVPASSDLPLFALDLLLMNILLMCV